MLSEKIGKRMSDSFDIPKDVTMDLPKIVLNGDLEVICEGYRGLIEYTETEIKLSAGRKKLEISGASLAIKSIDDEEIVIAGCINSVKFI